MATAKWLSLMKKTDAHKQKGRWKSNRWKCQSEIDAKEFNNQIAIVMLKFKENKMNERNALPHIRNSNQNLKVLVLRNIGSSKYADIRYFNLLYYASARLTCKWWKNWKTKHSHQKPIRQERIQQRIQINYIWHKMFDIH